MEDNISFADFLWGWAPQEFAVIGSLSGPAGRSEFNKIPSHQQQRPTTHFVVIDISEWTEL